MKKLFKKILGKILEKLKGRGWKTWATAVVIGIGAGAESLGLTEISKWIPKILSWLGGGG